MVDQLVKNVKILKRLLKFTVFEFKYTLISVIKRRIDPFSYRF